ncbi:MAG: type II toxin-antitoxin system YafQ family toxin [Longimicrobiales bacterium]|nr:type II toxin-antitoxin system YafQ family toxin [Longimicrobiales bacterium]
MKEPRPSLRPARTAQFKRDLERCRRRGYDMDVARVVMGRLIHRTRLDEAYRDHPLRGEWEGHRECHLGSDWLLVYRITDGTITFERTGTHADLFDE